MILEKIKNSIRQYFIVWYIPILSYSIPFITYEIATKFRSDIIITISLLLLYGNILGNCISAIVQIIIKKWYYLFPQFIISAGIFFYVSILLTFSPPDYYGANKEIPKNIDISNPIKNHFTEQELKNHKLVLASSSQPGIYNYYTNYKPSELGNFYIKASEITSKDKLSEDEINIRSKVKVENLEPKIYSGEFTIYEGSWGDKYAAKIELWFKPENGSKEYKIDERNYIVEGWMR